MFNIADLAHIADALIFAGGALISVFFLGLLWRMNFLHDTGNVAITQPTPRQTQGAIKTIVWLWQKDYLSYGDAWVTAFANALKWSLLFLPLLYASPLVYAWRRAHGL